MILLSYVCRQGLKVTIFEFARRESKQKKLQRLKPKNSIIGGTKIIVNPFVNHEFGRDQPQIFRCSNLHVVKHLTIVVNEVINEFRNNVYSLTIYWNHVNHIESCCKSCLK